MKRSKLYFERVFGGEPRSFQYYIFRGMVSCFDEIEPTKVYAAVLLDVYEHTGFYDDLLEDGILKKIPLNSVFSNELRFRIEAVRLVREVIDEHTKRQETP